PADVATRDHEQGKVVRPATLAGLDAILNSETDEPIEPIDILPDGSIRPARGEVAGLVEQLEAQAALYERDMGEEEAMLMREAAAALTRMQARCNAAEQALAAEKAARESAMWQPGNNEEGD